jgi:hypothetical protein
VAAAASPKGAQISTSLLGGASTVVASFLARTRGSGEPELSRDRARDLEKVRSAFPRSGMNTNLPTPNTSSYVLAKQRC